MKHPGDRPTRSTSRDEGLEDARAACAEGRWSTAYELLTQADEAAALGPEDLERLATAAYLIGRDEAFFSVLERAYRGWLGTTPARATRCAFWLGQCLLLEGKSARANGWFARAHEQIDREPGLHAESGYLLIPQIERQLIAGDWDSARTNAKRAVDIGETFDEPDLRACARHQYGRALVGASQVEQGLALLDQVMLDVSAGTLSPIMTGLLYCSVIDALQKVYATARAREWTDALAEWCEGQPQMIAFSGTCLIHRAEIMQLNGQWPDAIHEARRACDRYARAGLRPAGAAYYRQAEVHRLRGEYDAAETSYREASQSGFEPQPGLALLRMAQGNDDVACGSIRRLAGATKDPLKRARLLPACVDIMLAVGEIDDAREACRELTEIAGHFGTESLSAMAAQSEAAVSLTEGHAQHALELAQKAFHVWQSVEAPYETACARILMGMACQALGDDDGANLELDAAATMLAQLGAAPELHRVEELRRGRSGPGATHGLTPRELEVLRLVAAGNTNKTIAAELSVSEKTVDRHLSNIFNKLDVSTRTAAAAFAYEHKLI